MAHTHRSSSRQRVTVYRGIDLALARPWRAQPVGTPGRTPRFWQGRARQSTSSEHRTGPWLQREHRSGARGGPRRKRAIMARRQWAPSGVGTARFMQIEESDGRSAHYLPGVVHRLGVHHLHRTPTASGGPHPGRNCEPGPSHNRRRNSKMQPILSSHVRTAMAAPRPSRTSTTAPVEASLDGLGTQFHPMRDHRRRSAV